MLAHVVIHVIKPAILCVTETVVLLLVPQVVLVNVRDRASAHAIEAVKALVIMGVMVNVLEGLVQRFMFLQTPVHVFLIQ